MLNIKPGRKTKSINPVLKAVLLKHMDSNSISIPTLSTDIGISKHQLYKILSGRSGITSENDGKIQAYIEKENL